MLNNSEYQTMKYIRENSDSTRKDLVCAAELPGTVPQKKAVIDGLKSQGLLKSTIQSFDGKWGIYRLTEQGLQALAAYEDASQKVTDENARKTSDKRADRKLNIGLALLGILFTIIVGLFPLLLRSCG